MMWTLIYIELWRGIWAIWRWRPDRGGIKSNRTRSPSSYSEDLHDWWFGMTGGRIICIACMSPYRLANGCRYKVSLRDRALDGLPCFVSLSSKELNHLSIHLFYQLSKNQPTLGLFWISWLGRGTQKPRLNRNSEIISSNNIIFVWKHSLVTIINKLFKLLYLCTAI